MHLPHLMQSDWSITDCPPTTEIAFFGQLYTHGRAKQPRQLGVETTFESGQPLHAGTQTLSGACGLSGCSAPPPHAFSA